MRRLLLISAILVTALWVAGEAAWACKLLGCGQGRWGGHGCGGCEAVTACREPAPCQAMARARCGRAARCCVPEEPVCCQPEAPVVQPAPSPSDIVPRPVAPPKAPAKLKPAVPPAPAKVVVPPKAAAPVKPAAPPAVKAPPPAPGAPPAPPKPAEKMPPAPAPAKAEAPKPAAPPPAPPKAEAPAPAKAEPPKLPPPPAPEKKPEAPAKKTSAVDRGLRTWTDRTGQHRLVARLVSVLEGDLVRLQRADGAYVRVALERLSVGDRQYIGSVQGSLAAR